MKKPTREERAELVSTVSGRKELGRMSFKAFFLIYFQKDIHFSKIPSFHNERFDAVMKRKKIYAKGMRGIAKTTILGVANIIRRIVYGKVNYCCILCYDQLKAKGLTSIIRNELVRNEMINNDFGKMYSHQKSEDDGFDTKSITEFVTTNYIKVKAFGMGMTLRGEVYSHPKNGKVRPDFLLIDDIDNNDNTKNKRIIKDDMDFLEAEVFGGMEQGKSSIVWLGNVIRKDGRNVRQEKIVKQSDDWVYFDNFLYGKSGQTDGPYCRERYVTTIEEESETRYGKTVSVERLKKDWQTGFSQNALGIPITDGDVLYSNDLTKIVYEVPKELNVVIGVDPAFSLKTGSDGVGICVVGTTGQGDYKKIYILRAFALYGKNKDEENIKKVIEELYKNYNARKVKIENNNGGVIIERVLSKQFLATETITSTKDKATRFLEIKGNFLRGNVFFLAGMCDPLLLQLDNFTGEDGGDDDIVDAMVHAIGTEDKGYFF